MNKVSWPTWKELQSSALLVLFSALLIAAIVFIMDFVFGVNDLNTWKGMLGFIYKFLG